MSNQLHPNLSESENTLHQRAVNLSREHRRLEWEIVCILQEIDRKKIHRKLGATSLFSYAVQILGLSEGVAQAFIVVARKSMQVNLLAEAIQEQKLSVNKASRLTSVITVENAAELLYFAQTHTSRQIEFEVARRNPRAAAKNIVKPISEDLVEVRLTVSKVIYDKWLRVQNLIAQKTAKHAAPDAALEGAFDVYLDRHDPIRKAQRILNKTSEARPSVQPNWPDPVSSEQPRTCKISTEREPLTAQQKHIVAARDQGRCTYEDENGKRCESERWLEIHHLKPVSIGGSNDPKNLATLCSTHHDLIHCGIAG